MLTHLAFLDEWGNNGFDFTKSGVSTHFLVVALTLPDGQRVAAQAHVGAVRARFFQQGPIKSSTLGRGDERRLRVLEALLTDAPFRVFALVVDKRELEGDGFRYKPSFYKFLHSLVERELFRTFPNLTMMADRHGSDSFMASFVRYVQANHVPNLFNESSFGFVDSRDHVLVQAADLVGGALARCYDETVLSPRRADYVQLLRPVLTALRVFPPDRFTPLVAPPPNDASKYDPRLADLSLLLAQDVLHKRLRNRSSLELDQAACLSYLIFQFRQVNPTRYVSSRELMEYIRGRRPSSLTLHRFQTQIIARLRDAGVLIASSSRGYKLPACLGDLHDFINHSNTIIQPLLSRVGRCVERIRLATHGEVDLLQDEAYQSLRQALGDRITLA